MPCEIRRKQMGQVQHFVKQVFPDILSNPLVQMSVELALIPLYRQLTNLFIAERAYPDALMANNKVNPLLKEIRAVIKDVQGAVKNIAELDSTKLNRMKRAGGETPGAPMTTGSYYDMLLVDGKAEPSEPLDVELHN